MLCAALAGVESSTTDTHGCQNRRVLGQGTDRAHSRSEPGKPLLARNRRVRLWACGAFPRVQDLPFRHSDANDARLTGVRRRRAESRYQARVSDRARDVTHAFTHAICGPVSGFIALISPEPAQAQCYTLRDNCRFSRRPSPPTRRRLAERPMAVGPLFFPRRDITERVPPGADLGSYPHFPPPFWVRPRPSRAQTRALYTYATGNATGSFRSEEGQ